MTFPSPWLRRLHFHAALGCAFLVLPASIFATSPPAQIANISTRMLCGRKDNVIVNEFAIQGTTSKEVILRAIGPSLRDFGVQGALKNPTLTLLDANGNLIDFNDDWVDSPDKAAIEATGLAPTDDRESAILQTLSPGLYTAVLAGMQRTMGVALAEVYDLDSFNMATMLPSVGTRGFVSTAENVMISGVILTGTNFIPVLVRALGPSLGDAGVRGALANPTLELHDANGILIAVNDNWRDTQEAEIEASGFAPDNDLESALIVNLSPGAYTAIVRGLSETVGVGFVQFYSLATPGPELNPAPIIRPRH